MRCACLDSPCPQKVQHFSLAQRSIAECLISYSLPVCCQLHHASAKLHVSRIAEMVMHARRAAAAALRTVYKKYSHSNHSKVSLLQPPLSLLEEA